MVTGMRSIGLLFAVVTFSAGIARATPSTNGPYLNGPYLNGPYLNGPYLNGPYLNGGTVDGTSVSQLVLADGRPVAYAWVWNSELEGWVIAQDPQTGGWSWQYVSGADFVGATTQGILGPRYAPDPPDPDTGKVVEMRITGTTALAPDMRFYTSEVRVPTATDPTRTAWKPACGCEPGTGETFCGPWGCWTIPCDPVPAIVLGGAWDATPGARWGGAKISDDPSLATFACVNAALGKCAAEGHPNTLGYVPWRPGYRREWVCTPSADPMSAPSCTWIVASIDYVDEHQACTRMIRADYCGDGVSHTVSGKDIEVYDHNTNSAGAEAPLNVDTRPWMPFEGSWTPLGGHQLGYGRCGPIAPTCTKYGDYKHDDFTACFTDEPIYTPPSASEDPDPPLLVNRTQVIQTPTNQQ